MTEEQREQKLARRRARYAANPEKFRVAQNKRRVADPEKWNETQRKRRAENPGQDAAFRRAWIVAHPEEAEERRRVSAEKRKLKREAAPGSDAAYQRARYAEKKAKKLALIEADRLENPQKYKALAEAKEAERIRKARENSRKKWLRNRVQINEKKRSSRKVRRVVDISFALTERLRKRLWHASKKVGIKKSAKTLELIGCTLPFLREYIEARFLPGMSWENRTDWHVDHILPCASFDLTKPEQQRACFHYSNLQPLWAADNLKKRDKVLHRHQPELI